MEPRWDAQPFPSGSVAMNALPSDSKSGTDVDIIFLDPNPFKKTAPPSSAINDAARPSGTSDRHSRRGFTITGVGLSAGPLKCASNFFAALVGKSNALAARAAGDCDRFAQQFDRAWRSRA
jgi:hypothetical protein